jgi:hypothetical protein
VALAALGRVRHETRRPGTPVGYRPMRVTLVSAHYPPNFVSGGTLQPQRIARGLVARDHEVRVFAGCLDSRRTPSTAGRTPTTTGSRALAGHHAVDRLGGRAQLRQPRRGGRVRRPPRGPPGRRRAPPHPPGPRRGPDRSGQALGGAHGRDHARLLVGVCPAVPRRPGPPAVLPRRRGRRLRLRRRSPPPRSAGGPARGGLAVGRRRARPVGLGGRGAARERRAR